MSHIIAPVAVLVLIGVIGNTYFLLKSGAAPSSTSTNTSTTSTTTSTTSGAPNAATIVIQPGDWQMIQDANIVSDPTDSSVGNVVKMGSSGYVDTYNKNTKTYLKALNTFLVDNRGRNISICVHARVANVYSGDTGQLNVDTGYINVNSIDGSYKFITLKTTYTTQCFNSSIRSNYVSGGYVTGLNLAKSGSPIFLDYINLSVQ